MSNTKSLTTSAALLENLPRTPGTKALRDAAARDVAKELLAYYEAEGLDLVGFCPHCPPGATELPEPEPTTEA